MSKRKRGLRRLSFLALPVFILAVLGVLFLGADQLCINDANRRLPYYPGAVRVEERHNGLRLRGIGNSFEVFRTADSRETVEAWYEQHTIKLLNANRQLGPSTLNRIVEDDAGETQIIYVAQCIL